MRRSVVRSRSEANFCFEFLRARPPMSAEFLYLRVSLTRMYRIQQILLEAVFFGELFFAGTSRISVHVGSTELQYQAEVHLPRSPRSTVGCKRPWLSIIHLWDLRHLGPTSIACVVKNLPYQALMYYYQPTVEGGGTPTTVQLATIATSSCTKMQILKDKSRGAKPFAYS